MGTAKLCGVDSDKLTYYDFTIKKEHHFLRNIFTENELKSSPTNKTLTIYYDFFQKFMQITANLLTKKYSDKANIEDLDNPIMVDFMNGCSFETIDEF